MGKNEKSNGRISKLFEESSSLQKFIDTYSEYFESLTSAEVEVLRMVAVGLKNPDMAEKL
jgi:DNA-binding NarL/FixJ family response regulator